MSLSIYPQSTHWKHLPAKVCTITKTLQDRYNTKTLSFYWGRVRMSAPAQMVDVLALLITYICMWKHHTRGTPQQQSYHVNTYIKQHYSMSNPVADVVMATFNISLSSSFEL